MNKTIAQYAFINAQILQVAHCNPHFQEVVKQVAESYKIENYEFINSAYVASLLYCLLVIPREVFVAGNGADLNSRLSVNEVTKYFEIQLDTERVVRSTSRFLRRLRNSIAHARFSVDNNQTFTFKDRPSSSSEDDFIITISIANLEKFLSTIGSFLANLRSNPLKNPSGKKDTVSKRSLEN